MGCHFLLQCMKVKSESEVPQSCPTLSNPMDCSPPGSSIHGIFQARVLEHWSGLPFPSLGDMAVLTIYMGFPGGASGEESACQFRRHKRHELVPWSGRHGGRGLGNPFPCSSLGNLLDRRVWQTAVCGVTKSCTGLSTAQHGVYRIQS